MKRASVAVLTRCLAAALMVMSSFAAQATLLTYEWSIDWQTRPDQSGALTFDDESDPRARSVQWLPLYGPQVPSTIMGLPFWLQGFGSLSFDGNVVSGLYGCSDYFEACNDSFATASGWTKASFSLGAEGDATGWTYSYDGSDPDSLCNNAFALLPRSCFSIELGITSFTAVEPTAPIPEPSTWALLGAGLLSLAPLLRRQARRGASASAP